MATKEELAKAAARMREYRAAHRERISQQRKAKYRERAAEMRQRALDRYYANHDVIRQQRKARYAAKPKPKIERTPEQKAAHREYMREWARRHRARLNPLRNARRRANPEPYRQRDRARYTKTERREYVKKKAREDFRANHEKRLAQNRAWQRANPDVMAEIKRRRRAHLANVKVEKVSAAAIYERDGGLCGICHELVERAVMTLDHIIPLSKGGDHVESNLQTAHRTCNSRKGAKLATRAA